MDEVQEEKDRTFISIELTEEIREKITALAGQLDQYGAKPVAKENLHITLFFLGYTDTVMLEKIKKILAEIKHSKFYISVKGIGTFSQKDPSVIFANVDEGKAEIKSVYVALLKRFKATGADIDTREYHPHITIARARHRCDKKQNLRLCGKELNNRIREIPLQFCKNKEQHSQKRWSGIFGHLHTDA